MEKFRLKIEKILVFRNDRLGEFLLIIPALRALKKVFQAKITVVANPYLKELAKCIPEVDEVLIWEPKKHSLREIFSFSSLLRKKKFDLAVIFNPTKEAHLISFLSRIPLRLGYHRKWGFLLNRKIKDEKDQSRLHEVEYNLQLVKEIGAYTEDLSLRIELPQEELNKTQDFLISQTLEPKNYIVISPFCSNSLKEWPLKNFLELAEKLGKDIKVVVTGSREDQERGRLFNGLKERGVLNLIGKTDLLQLAGILKYAEVLISNDSGPVHLACCVGVETVVLFGNTKPSQSSRRWRPWGEGHIVIQKPQIFQIRVEEVLRILKDAIF